MWGFFPPNKGDEEEWLREVEKALAELEPKNIKKDKTKKELSGKCPKCHIEGVFIKMALCCPKCHAVIGGI